VPSDGVAGPEEGMPTATLDLPCARSAAFHARRWVMQQYLRWAFAGRGETEHLFDDLVLCVSELVTGAVESRANGLALTLERNPTAIRLTMRATPPTDQTLEPLPGHGTAYRARIIDAVATRWGVETAPGGEETWIEFALDTVGAAAR